MEAKSTINNSERFAALTLVATLHILALALLLAVKTAAAPDPVKPSALSLISIAQAEPVAPPPSIALSKLIKDLQPPAKPSLNVDPNAAAAAGLPGNCATLETVLAAVTTDPAAVASIVGTPPELRSISDAIIIWNAGWSEVAAAPDAPLSLVRSNVQQSLSTVDDNCLDETVVGPRLMPIPAGSGTMFLVLGSGIWSWRELLRDTAPLPAPQLSQWMAVL